jgi:hypothetical protein
MSGIGVIPVMHPVDAPCPLRALVDGRSRSWRVPGARAGSGQVCPKMALSQVKSRIAWLDRVVRDRIELSTFRFSGWRTLPHQPLTECRYSACHFPVDQIWTK